jgi:4-aminobutyrate aminotransferase-like enzyme
MRALSEMTARYELVHEVRGKGLMLAIDFARMRGVLRPQLPRLANPVMLVRAGTVVTAKGWSA